jgi:hypothetical protein
MVMSDNFLKMEYAAGETITTEDGVRITPFSKILRIRVPGLKGGLIWNRPASVLVERDGKEKVMTIPDPTRTAQWMLFFSSLLVPLAIWLLIGRRR